MSLPNKAVVGIGGIKFDHVSMQGSLLHEF